MSLPLTSILRLGDVGTAVALRAGAGPGTDRARRGDCLGDPGGGRDGGGSGKRPLPSCRAALDGEAGAAIIAEEATGATELDAMAAWLERQPAWSDLPIVVLTRHGGGAERNPRAARLSHLFGNVTFLERPFHPTTLVSLASTALRGRRRQYEARARIEEVRQGERRYRTLFEALDAGFCIIEMLFAADGTPTDYEFLEANPAFHTAERAHRCRGSACARIGAGP